MRQATTADLYDPLEDSMDNSPAIGPDSASTATDTDNTKPGNEAEENDNAALVNNEAATPERSESPIFPLVNKETSSDAIFPDDTDAATSSHEKEDHAANTSLSSANATTNSSELDIVQGSQQSNDDEMEVLNDVGGSPGKDVTEESPSNNVEDKEQPPVAVD